MSEVPVSVAVRRLGLAVMLTLGLPVVAQQSVDVTAPLNSETVTANDNLRPTRRLPDAGNSGSSFLDKGSGFDILPIGPQPVILNNNSAQLQKFLDGRKNWGLLTPKEILNIPTPESILNLPDAENDSGLSPEERYMQRRNRESESSGTNGFRRSNSSFDRDNIWDRQTLRGKDGNNSRLEEIQDSSRLAVPESIKGLKPMDAHNLSPLDARNQLDGNWTSPFGAPMIETKQSAEQLAGMERFRALMEPPAPLVKPGASGLPALSASAQDPFASPSASASKPIGRGFTALESTVSRPASLQSQSASPTDNKKVSWVQPPPWATSSATPNSQNPSFQQRQF